MIYFCIFFCFITYLIFSLAKTRYQNIRNEFPSTNYFEKNKLVIINLTNDVYNQHIKNQLDLKQILLNRSFEKIDKLDSENQVYSINNIDEINKLIDYDISLLIFSILSLENKHFRTNILYNKCKDTKNPYFYKTLDLIRGELYLKNEKLIVKTSEKYYDTAIKFVKMLNY